MIELHENDYILGIWFAEKHDFGNWICIIKRGKDPNGWVGGYRFRQFSDNKVFDSEDLSESYNIKEKIASEEQMIKSINNIFSIVKLKYCDVHEFVEVKGNLDKLVELTKNSSWFHMKFETVH